jgi:translation initiation factor 5
LQKKKETDSICGAENEKEIVGEAERLDIRDKAPLVLAELLFDQDILKQTTLYRTLFLRFSIENEKAQKYLLGGIEQLIGNVHPKELMPKVPIILKKFYDLDILEEEVSFVKCHYTLSEIQNGVTCN